MNAINKRNIFIMVAVFVLGLLLGWLILGGPSPSPDEAHDHAQEAEGETTYTCSMHPQIRQGEPGDCPICGMDLIPLEEDGAEESDENTLRMSPTAMQLAGVQTSVITTGQPVKSLRLSGKVQADERLVYTQPAHFPGRIERLMVNFTGEYVSRGQVLAHMYSPELVAAQQELIEAQKIKETQPALFNSAKEKLRNWKLSDGQIDQILASGKAESTFPIQANTSGYVTRMMVRSGDYIQRGQAVYEITDLSKVWVLFDVYESDLPWVKRGDTVDYTISSLPGETFTGTVAYIDPVIDSQARIAKARIEVNNSDQKLKPEMFASGIVESQLSNSQSALVVPKSAVMWTGEKSVVYVKSETDQGVSFVMREVVLGVDLGDAFVIVSGLDAGEEIVTNGTFSVDAAAQLAGKPSMMNRPATKTLDAPLAFREQITALAHVYFEVKNALVADDEAAAASAATKIEGTLENVNMGLLDGPAHDHWMALSGSMSEAGFHISEVDDIEVQREHFQVLSDAVLEMTEYFGLEIDRVYKQFCPMAFDDEGAHWLSESDDILNPYFGDMMLRCGEVQETYRKGLSVAAKEETETHQARSGHKH
jgi:membrane fusion protein, copper/silver efflux system